MSHGELMQKCIVVNSLLEPYYLIIYKVAKGDLKLLRQVTSVHFYVRILLSCKLILDYELKRGIPPTVTS